MQHKGFSLIEILLVTAVMAAVMSMVFPNITRFLDVRLEKNEEIIMAEIERALARYARENKRLPDPSEPWHRALSVYSELSEDDILYSLWRRDDGSFIERKYLRTSVSKPYQQSQDFDVFYAAVYSYGHDGCVGYEESETVCTQLLDADMDSESEFQTLSAAQGDYIAKHNDYRDKIDAYEKTIFRLNNIAEALTAYATAYYNENVVNDAAQTLIYYPPSGESSLFTSIGNRYHDIAIWDVENTGGAGAGAQQFDMPENNDLRLEEMQGLMRILGLPETYCCNALATFIDDDDEEQETPFYYYSNPCDRDVGDDKLPARISVTGGSC